MALRTSLFIDLAGNMAARAHQLLGGLQRLGAKGSHSMTVLNRTIQATGRGLDRLGNRYTAMLSGAAGIGTVKQVGDLSMRLTRLGINADVSRAQIDRLYDKIMDTAQMPDVRVDPGEIMSGVEKIVQKLGDLDLATRHTRTIGLVVKATGASGEDVGDLIANFKEKFRLSDDEILPAFDILVKQGKAGAFELKDMVTQGNRVTAAYGSMGRTGMNAVREMGSMMQVFKKSTGSSEEVATSFKNVFNDLMEPSKKKYLQALKINIWDPEKLKAGKKQIRSIVDIMDEILKKTNGDPEKLNRIFGMQSLDGLKAFMNEYQATGKNAADKFMGITGDGATLMQDAAKAAVEFNSSMQSLYTSWQRFSNSNLLKPMQHLANIINSLKPETVDLWLKIGGGVALALGAGVLATKGWKGINKVRGWFTNGKPGTEMPGGIPGAGNAVPVYVVNMPGSIPGVPDAPGGNPGTKPGGGGKMGKVMSVLGKAGAVTGVGLAAYGITSLAMQGVGWGVGKATGGKYSGAGFFGEMIYDLLHSQKTEKAAGAKTEVGGRVQIEIQDNRTVVKEVRSVNPSVDLDVSTGLLMRQ